MNKIKPESLLKPKTYNLKAYCMMSGGVDSSVAAALLVQQGYDVTGVFMKNWSPSSIQSLSDCPWEQDQADAEAVCRQLGIPFRSVNFEKEYRQKVVDYFLSEYRVGRTPNPDVVCNREIKFGIFLDWARSNGTDFVATGHYVRKVETRHGASLRRGVDVNKDQSYFLWTLTQDQLKYCLFPIGDLKKSEVRQIAQKFHLPTAKKKDSQGICFIGAINVGQFLRHEIAAKPGRVIGPTGQIVGRHDGVVYYTIGQRHGFQLDQPQALSAIFKDKDIPPLFVVEKDLKKNVLYVGEKDDPRLWLKDIVVDKIHWIDGRGGRYARTGNISAQIRYHQKPVECQIEQTNEKTITHFKIPVWAPAVGQSVVFYFQNQLIGGGIITQ